MSTPFKNSEQTPEDHPDSKFTLQAKSLLASIKANTPESKIFTLMFYQFLSGKDKFTKAIELNYGQWEQAFCTLSMAYSYYIIDGKNPAYKNALLKFTNLSKAKFALEV